MHDSLKFVFAIGSKLVLDRLINKAYVGQQA